MVSAWKPGAGRLDAGGKAAEGKVLGGMLAGAGAWKPGAGERAGGLSRLVGSYSSTGEPEGLRYEVHSKLALGPERSANIQIVIRP